MSTPIQLVTTPHQAGSARRLRLSTEWLFLLPSTIVIAVLMIYPLCDEILLSTQHWDGLGPRIPVGLANYAALFQDSNFWLAVQNNVTFSFWGVSGTILIGFVLAFAIERRVLGWRAFKVIYFIPVLISMSVVSVLWSNIYDPNSGVLNSLLRAIGFGQLAMTWLGDPAVAMFAITGVWIWQYAGLPMLYFLAAMEGIPIEIHDAATVDGVSTWQRARYVIFPLIRPVFVTIVLLQIIFSLKVFDIVFVMTRGGPGFSTTVWAMLLWLAAFDNNEFGYAAAIAVVMLALIGAMSLLFLHVFRVEAYEY